MSTSIYHKPVFRGVFANFEDFTPMSRKSRLLPALLSRTFNLCSSFEFFHQKIVKWKDTLKKMSILSALLIFVLNILDIFFIGKRYWDLH